MPGPGTGERINLTVSNDFYTRVQVIFCVIYRETMRWNIYEVLVPVFLFIITCNGTFASDNDDRGTTDGGKKLFTMYLGSSP